MRISRRQFLTFAGAGALSELEQRSSLAAPAGRPNLVVMFSDQQHWQALGCVDKFFETPNLDRLAAVATLFDRSFCTTPQCSPSRSSLMTGLCPSKTGVMGNIGAAGGNNLRQKTIGAMLQECGYHTAYFGKWHLGGNPVGNAGWGEEWKQQKDPEVTRRAVEFLTGKGRHQQPFALFVSYLNPHDVYQFRPGTKDVSALHVPLPESWRRENFQGKPSVQKEFMIADQGRKIWGRPQTDWEEYRDFYQRKVALYDAEAGQVLRALRKNGLWENTIVFASSDHGDMDTNHKLIFKGPFMYEHMVRIPLIVRVPSAYGGGRPVRVMDYDAVNVDIVPTVLDFAGVPAIPSDGLSLKPVLTGKGPMRKRDFVIGQYYSKQHWVNPIRMIRTADFKYTRYVEHGEELYDLKNDPEEIVNLANDAGYARRKKTLRAELDHWIATNQDPFYSLKSTPLGARTGRLHANSSVV
jgi:arylsulfatase A-like enzyme